MSHTVVNESTENRYTKDQRKHEEIFQKVVAEVSENYTSSTKDPAVLNREDQALALRENTDLPLWYIAKELGYANQSGAWKAIERARKARESGAKTKRRSAPKAKEFQRLLAAPVSEEVYQRVADIARVNGTGQASAIRQLLDNALNPQAAHPAKTSRGGSKRDFGLSKDAYPVKIPRNLYADIIEIAIATPTKADLVVADLIEKALTASDRPTGPPDPEIERKAKEYDALVASGALAALGIKD